MSDNTEPAFPCEVYDETAMAIERKYGVTKREYFAAAALTGLTSNTDLLVSIRDAGLKRGISYVASIATYCYEQADAMIEAGRKP